MTCARTEKIKKKKKHIEATTKRAAAHRGCGCVVVSFATLNTVFTCSGGGFCPGLGEEVLDVAAAGLVGLCCFAKENKKFR